MRFWKVVHRTNLWIKPNQLPFGCRLSGIVKSMPDTPYMTRKRIPTGILWIGCISFLAACTLDEPTPGNVGNTLTLSANQNYSLTSLSWNPVKVTGFKEYVILQSTHEIPSSPNPVINSDVSVLKRIDDADITTFLASNILFSPNVCYKLYASVDDRFIQSGNICVEQDFELLNGFFDRGGHMEDLDEMVLFDRVEQNLVSYNFKEGNITNTVNDIVLSFPLIEISAWAGVTNVFAYDQSPGKLRKYRFPELTSNMYKDLNGVLFAVSVYNQFLFVAVEESGKAFQVLNRANLIITDSEEGMTGNRNIAVFPGDPVIALEISDNAIKRYSIDANGIITFLGTLSYGVSQLSTQNTTARGTDLFIAGRLGNLLDREGNILGALNSNINSSVIMARFSENAKKAIYIISDNVNFRLEVADITNPEHINSLVSYNIPSANYADLVIDDDVIYVVGVSFATGQAQTFVLKYPVP